MIHRNSRADARNFSLSRRGRLLHLKILDARSRLADLAVRIVCGSCGHFRQMHAFEVIRRARGKVEAEHLPLNTPLAGIFYCRRCRARVPVTLESPV